METEQVHRNSYLIRIWRQRGHVFWQGWVQHIRTGESATIQDLNELKDFFETYSGKLNKPPPKGLK